MYALRRQNWIVLFLLIETQNDDKSTLVVFFQDGIVKCFAVYGHRDCRERP